MPLLAFIPGNHQSARLPLHFHCTPDLLRYGRPRQAANRSVTERPTALDVSCSAVYARPCASRIVLSLRVSEKLSPLPSILATRDPYVLPGLLRIFLFSLSLSLISFLFIYTYLSSKVFPLFSYYICRVYEFTRRRVRSNVSMRL